MPPPNPQTAVLRIPQTFDLRPSKRSNQSAIQLLGYPDELMIDWGNTPQGSKLQIYWPQASSSDVVRLAMLLYATDAPRAVDLNTIECTVTSRVTFVPIPFGSGGNLAGLFTVDLPQGVVKGEEFQIVVRRIATQQTPPSVIATRQTAAAAQTGRSSVARRSFTRDWRYVVGTFQITIPVEPVDGLLTPAERTLSIMKWRLLQTPVANRWYPVLRRYVSYLAGNVDGYGGNAGSVVASPIGQLPLPIPGKGCADTIEHTGKVCDVLFDCFGDFEGFILETCSEAIRFKSHERGIAKIVLRACRDRLPLSVSVECGPTRKICKLIVHC